MEVDNPINVFVLLLLLVTLIKVPLLNLIIVLLVIWFGKGKLKVEHKKITTLLYSVTVMMVCFILINY